MFRIARVRIRWINTEQQESNVALANTAPSAGSKLLSTLGKLNPQYWRVRVKWVGFDLTDRPMEVAPVSAPLVDKVVASPPVRVSRTFEIRGVEIRVSWVRSESASRVGVWAWGLFLLSLGIFLFTRLAALDRFPIYFFSDEAIQVVYASGLLQRGFHDAQGHLFPVYFQNGSYWNLSLSVYIHALTVKLFGISIFVTRATSALIALSGAVAVSLILKWIFQIRWWWLGTLVLAATPAWFLHSRTAFETVMMVSFYSWFLLFYLLYRYRSANFLYAALIFGAATFYTYSPGQAIILISGIGLLCSDWRYHLEHRRTGIAGLGLLALFFLPYLSFRLQHPDAVVFQLRALHSYWLQEITLPEKIRIFVKTYGYGLSPQYWFFPNDHDLIRHHMKEYGNIASWELPFYLVGLGVCIRRFRSSAHRALFIALLSAPFGSALVDILITRALLFVVPAAILAVLGFDALLNLIKNSRPQWALAIGATAAISLWSLAMWNNAVTKGSLWYSDYTLYGMQWGAKQIFETLPTFLKKDPDSKIYVATDWANGTDIFVPYFMPGETRVLVEDVDKFILDKQPLDGSMLFVLSPNKYNQVLASGRFQQPQVEKILKYPDGRDGFYFVRLTYVKNIDGIFATEHAERTKPVTDELNLNGETIKIAHSRLDMGGAENAFDNDPFTVMRGMEANPFLLDIEFQTPRPMTGLVMNCGKMNIVIRVQAYDPEGNPPSLYQAEHHVESPDLDVDLSFINGPALVKYLHIEIEQLLPPPEPHIHIFEIHFKE